MLCQPIGGVLDLLSGVLSGGGVINHLDEGELLTFISLVEGKLEN